MNEQTEKYPITEADSNMLRNNFVYHAPKPGQPERYTTIRDNAGFVAGVILMNCPPSRERSLALTKLEEAVFWANASIARGE